MPNDATAALLSKLAVVGVTAGVELIRSYLDAKAVHRDMSNEEFIVELQRMQQASEQRAKQAGDVVRDTD